MNPDFKIKFSPNRNVSLNGFIGIFLIFIFLISCKGAKEARFRGSLESNNCQQEFRYLNDNFLSQDDFDLAYWRSIFGDDFSDNSIMVAHTINLKDLLLAYRDNLDNFQNDPSLENKVAVMDNLQSLNHRINLVSLEISAVIAELDCEEEKAVQIGNFMRKKEGDTNTKLTVGSIVVGALGAVMTSVLVLNDREVRGERVAIGTAVIGAAFGFAILANKRKVDFYHERNPLKDFWEGGETSEIYPPAIWFYLNYEKNIHRNASSSRKELKQGWIEAEEFADMMAEKREALINLLFGKGGEYSADMLFQRADMLDQVEAQINWMKEDLRNLSMEILSLQTP
ncbi:hypothetical protein [Pararhodonellum marinum]|uniref:hypothetical protein n=1 Tax=Pararhodonellum marinum TaxID=2755358 RepID=UPI00188FA688|nr:hypothetical protein [Pararhodonellum marinum]